MKLIVCMSLFLLSAGNCFASQTDNEAIKSIVSTFKQSIEAKDKSRFEALFVDPSTPMVTSFSEDIMKIRRALVEKINKEENKKLVATRTFKMSPTQMIDMVVADEAVSTGEFDNIKIISDGNIATVNFDYVSYSGKKKQSWGSESWLMVQTLTGWKISAAVVLINGPIK